jgi:DNA-binding GntR family transcriptional regulator
MWTGKADQVYRILRDAIESGELAAGQSLPEIALVEKTGFSRTPVREALRQLAADGLVDIEPRRAPTVSRITVQGARDLFAFRRLVESAAVASLAGVVQKNEKAKSSVADLLGEFSVLAKQTTAPDFITNFYALAARFDELVVSFTPNHYISDSITALKPHLTRVRRISKTDLTRLPQSIAEHIEMSEAILAGDAERAASVLAAHLFHVEKAVFAQLMEGESPLGGAMDLSGS